VGTGWYTSGVWNLEHIGTGLFGLVMHRVAYGLVVNFDGRRATAVSLYVTGVRKAREEKLMESQLLVSENVIKRIPVCLLVCLFLCLLADGESHSVCLCLGIRPIN
jgi:hypothetical protein